MQRDRYEFHPIKDEIGSGSYGACYAARDKVTQRQVALKIITIKHDTPLAHLEREAKIMEALEHPHVAKGLGHFVEPFRDLESLYIVMELYPNGSLRQFINDNYDSVLQVSPRIRQRWMLQFLSAVEFLHGLQIVHRDLKQENLFVDQKLNAFLGDFGIARSVRTEQAKTYIGTPDTIAPEVIKGETEYGVSADMFSLGVVWFELISGRKPFSGQPFAIMAQISQLQFTPISPAEASGMEKYAEAVKRLLVLNPDDRPTAAQLMAEFQKDYEDVVEGGSVEEPLSQTVKSPLLPSLGQTQILGSQSGVELAQRVLEGEQVWHECGIDTTLDYVCEPIQSLEAEAQLMTQVFTQLGVQMLWRDAKRQAMRQLFGV